MEHNNILELIREISRSNIKEFEYSEGDTKIYLSKENACDALTNVAVNTCGFSELQANTIVSDNSEVKSMDNKKIVNSPLVGTFYAAPAEDAPAFVQVGDVVKKGQVLAIVEAMKLMNDIESDFDGKIVEIYVSNGEGVEFGQPLFAIE